MTTNSLGLAQNGCLCNRYSIRQNLKFFYSPHGTFNVHSYIDQISTAIYYLVVMQYCLKCSCVHVQAYMLFILICIFVVQPLHQLTSIYALLFSLWSLNKFYLSLYLCADKCFLPTMNVGLAKVRLQLSKISRPLSAINASLFFNPYFTMGMQLGQKPISWPLRQSGVNNLHKVAMRNRLASVEIEPLFPWITNPLLQTIDVNNVNFYNK